MIQHRLSGVFLVITMSAGVFERGVYESDDGLVYSCRVQPETKGLTIDGIANDYSPEPVTQGLPTLALRQSRRGYGVKARTVTVELTADGTGPTADYLGEGSQLTVPIFDRAVWLSYAKGMTGVYLGIPCAVVRKDPELVR